MSVRRKHYVAAALVLSSLGLLATTACPSRDERVRPEPTPDASPTPPPPPLHDFVGDWISDRDRPLRAVAVDDRTIEFRIVDDAPDYKAGEVRFTLRRADDGELHVIDRYRPQPPAGFAYSAAGFADCLYTFRKYEHEPLIALLQGGVLDVEMAWVATHFEASDAGRTIEGCHGATIERVEHARLKRKPD